MGPAPPAVREVEMLSNWNDLNALGFGDVVHSAASLAELHRRVERAMRQAGPRHRMATADARWIVKDTGESLELRAELPGFQPGDVDVSVEDGHLTIFGQRSASPPEGYAVLRKERGELPLRGSLELPCPVDLDRAEASLDRGVLRLTLPKTPQAKPRRIAINAS